MDPMSAHGGDGGAGPAGLPFQAGEVRTDRAVLRPFARRDLPDVERLLGREDVVRYLDWDVHTAQEASDALERWTGMTRLAADGDTVYFAVEAAGVDGDSGSGAADGRGRVVGEIILVLESVRDGRLEIGWIFHPDVHGLGLAGEAARAVLVLCFRALGAHKVVAKLDARNTASAALADRLGMRREAVLRDDHVSKGEWVSVAFHSVLAEEYLGGSRD